MPEEPTIIEWYGDKEIMAGCIRMVGFDENRGAWENTRQHLEDLWGDWVNIGSAVDYENNAAFAHFNGAPFKLDNPTSLARVG